MTIFNTAKCVTFIFIAVLFIAAVITIAYIFDLFGVSEMNIYLINGQK